MWKKIVLEINEVTEFLNSQKIKPGEVLVLRATEAQFPFQTAVAEILYFDKGQTQ